MAFWDIFWNEPERKYSREEIEHLLEKIKHFNAGAIDEYLSKHVDEAYKWWLLDVDDDD